MPIQTPPVPARVARQQFGELPEAEQLQAQAQEFIETFLGGPAKRATQARSRLSLLRLLLGRRNTILTGPKGVVGEETKIGRATLLGS